MNPAVRNSADLAEEVRPDFPVLQQLLYGRWPLVYLDNAASTHRPRPVLQAMQRCEEEIYANVHRGNHWLSETISAAFEEARGSLGRFLNAGDARQVLFTSGTTAGINLVAHAWGNRHVRAGDEILLTIADHHSNIVPWQQLAARTGSRIVWYDHRIEEGIDLERWSELITPRTRLAAWPAVSNMLGFLAPSAAMAAAARSRGVVTLIDAAQHVAHEVTDLQAWGADFAAFSGHKMFGPTGVGVLCGRREILEPMDPFLGGGSMIDSVTREGFVPGELPARFEAGTPPIVQAIGLAAAASWLQTTGLERIRVHERELTLRCMQRLGGISGLRVHGPPPEARAGIVSFSVAGVNPQDLGKMLDLKGIATRAGHHCTMPLHQQLGIASSLRASFCPFNTAGEIDRFARQLEESIGRLRS